MVRSVQVQDHVKDFARLIAMENEAVMHPFVLRRLIKFYKSMGKRLGKKLPRCQRIGQKRLGYVRELIKRLHMDPKASQIVRHMDTLELQKTLSILFQEGVEPKLLVAIIFGSEKIMGKKIDMLFKQMCRASKRSNRSHRRIKAKEEAGSWWNPFSWGRKTTMAVLGAALLLVGGASIWYYMTPAAVQAAATPAAKVAATVTGAATVKAAGQKAQANAANAARQKAQEKALKITVEQAAESNVKVAQAAASEISKALVPYTGVATDQERLQQARETMAARLLPTIVQGPALKGTSRKVVHEALKGKNAEISLGELAKKAVDGKKFQHNISVSVRQNLLPNVKANSKAAKVVEDKVKNALSTSLQLPTAIAAATLEAADNSKAMVIYDAGKAAARSVEKPFRSPWIHDFPEDRNKAVRSKGVLSQIKNAGKSAMDSLRGAASALGFGPTGQAPDLPTTPASAAAQSYWSRSRLGPKYLPGGIPVPLPTNSSLLNASAMPVVSALPTSAAIPSMEQSFLSSATTLTQGAKSAGSTAMKFIKQQANRPETKAALKTVKDTARGVGALSWLAAKEAGKGLKYVATESGKGLADDGMFVVNGVSNWAQELGKDLKQDLPKIGPGVMSYLKSGAKHLKSGSKRFNRKYLTPAARLTKFAGSQLLAPVANDAATLAAAGVNAADSARWHYGPHLYEGGKLATKLMVGGAKQVPGALGSLAKPFKDGVYNFFLDRFDPLPDVLPRT